MTPMTKDIIENYIKEFFESQHAKSLNRIQRQIMALSIRHFVKSAQEERDKEWRERVYNVTKTSRTSYEIEHWGGQAMRETQAREKLANDILLLSDTKTNEK